KIVACKTSLFKARIRKGVVGGSFKYLKSNKTFKGMFPLKKEVQITVVGKIWNANRGKILALNKCLDEYFKAVKYFFGFNSTSKTFLHKNGYEKAKQLFTLNTALIQTARDKAVEILKSFNEKKKEGKVKSERPKLERVSIRFDKRCYSFAKTTNVLTPYWLTLSLNRRTRISLPIKFGRRQQRLIEEALQGKWQFCTVEMVKRNGEWYAHFVLKKEIELIDEPETFIGVDLGEWNVAVAVAISKHNPKPMKGQFWSGAKIRYIRGKYAHIRRNLQRKKRIDLVKRIGSKEGRIVNQILHTIAKEVVEYAKQFPKPIIVMEKLKNIRKNMNGSAKLNRRLHAWSFRKIQMYIEYKANLEGIPVMYVNPKNSSKTCHRCGHVARKVEGREFRCPKCGLLYNRDLNSAINLARRIMSPSGWGCREPALNSRMKSR
ncbi:RNA-guided endonuclease InsQ/TnpB family protein, partial [Archaeoglobus sp.]